MDRTTDPHRAQSLSQRITLGEPDDILMEYVRRLWPAYRKHQRQIGEARVVTVRNGSPPRIGGREGSELDTEDRRLDGVEARVDADPGADVPLAPAIFPNFAQSRRERRIVCDEHATIAQGAEIFGRVETETRDIAERADRPAVIKSAVALRTIFDQPQSACLGDLGECR